MRTIFKDPDLQKAFDHKGYVVIDFLNAAEITALQQIYTSVPGDLGRPAFASSIMSRDIPYRIKISAAIEAAFKRPLDILCHNTQLFWGVFNIKYPNHQHGAVPLHQDPSYLDERLYRTLVIWVPLTDTSPENGALQVIPGSHPLLKGPRCGGRPFPFASLQQELLEQFGKSLSMRAGQAYIGNTALFHASPGNTGPEKRIAAAGLAGPAESSLKYFHYTQLNGTGYAEMFGVDRDYFVTQSLFSRPSPDRYPLLETIHLEENLPAAHTIFETLRMFKNNSHDTPGT